MIDIHGGAARVRKWITKQYPWIILGVVFAGLIFLNIFFLDHWLDSDMAAEMMFSKLLASEGNLFASHNWFYSTEFRVLYTQLIMVPLFHFFSNWHLIRAVTNIIFYVLLLLSYFYMVAVLQIERDKKILCAVALLLPFSETMMLHMQMGNTYMAHVILLFFYYGLFARLFPISTEVKEKEVSLKQKNSKLFLKMLQIFFFMILAFIFGLSGVRYILAIQAPLILATLIYWIQGSNMQEFRLSMDYQHWKIVISEERCSVFKGSLVAMLVTLAGYLVNIKIISKIYTFQSYDSIHFIDVYEGILMDRIQDTFGSLLMLFGYIPEKSVLSVRGFISLIAFCMMLLVGYGIWKSRRTKIPQHQFLVIFFFTAFFLNTFVFIFTDSTIVPRYYITSMVFAIPVMGIYLTEEKKVLDRRAIAILLILCLGASSLKVSASLALTDKNADRYGAITYLEDNQYYFGYATYWNGNITQELSNGTIELANIDDPENFDFFKWSTESSYYDLDYPTGKVFLLLTEEEATDYADAEVIQAGQKVYDDGVFVIYGYASNEDLLSHVE